MKFIFSFLLFSVLSLAVNTVYVPAVYAHGGEDQQTSSISANAHFRFANKGSVDHDQAWLIPGTLMGGEALPVEKGVAVEDVQLHGVWVPDENEIYNIEARLSSHHEGEVSVENILVNGFVNETLTVSAGKMDALFSPNASWHAYNDNFSEAPLNAQVFFGGHFIDTGLRADNQFHNFNMGVEFWNGDAWPASAGEYAADVYLHYENEMGNANIKSGLWSYYGEAEQRNDTRYSEGHSHSSVISNSGDFFFSGREKLSGAFVNLQWQLTDNKMFGLNSEFIQKQSEGDVNDSTRVLALEGKHSGYISSIYFKQSSITYALRHDAISFDNEVSGSAAAFLAADAGLVNDDFEPSRTHLSVSKEIDAFILRAEAVKDKSIEEDGISRFTASLIWQDTLWEKNN